MSRGCEAGHTARVLACVALMGLGAGCRSPFQRLTEDPAPKPYSEAAHPEIPQLQPVPEGGPGTVVAPVSRKASAKPNVVGSMPVAPSPAPTPMLDAALKHAEAIEQSHREENPPGDRPATTAAVSQPDPSGKDVAAATKNPVKDDNKVVRASKPASGQAAGASPPDAEAKVSSAAAGVTSLASEQSGRPKSADVAPGPPTRVQVIDWLASEAAKPANQVLFHRAVNTIADAVKNSARDESARTSDIRTTLLALEDRAPLGVSEPRLCRKVNGFGSFESLPDAALKAGQPFLMYCELTGLRYQARDTSFVSRVSSRVELISTRDHTKVWEQSLDEVEDQCRSRRRDNCVSYRIALPQTLAAGDYRLRLTVTDLVANRSASSELPLTVTR